MKLSAEELLHLPMFHAIDTNGIETMMDCFCGEIKMFDPGSKIHAEKAEQAGCLIEGEVDGLSVGQVFLLPKKEEAPLSVRTQTKLLLFDGHMMLYPCYGCCFFHAQLLQNFRDMGFLHD